MQSDFQPRTPHGCRAIGLRTDNCRLSILPVVDPEGARTLPIRFRNRNPTNQRRVPPNERGFNNWRRMPSDPHKNDIPDLSVVNSNWLRATTMARRYWVEYGTHAKQQKSQLRSSYLKTSSWRRSIAKSQTGCGDQHAIQESGFNTPEDTSISAGRKQIVENFADFLPLMT